MYVQRGAKTHALLDSRSTNDRVQIIPPRSAHTQNDVYVDTSQAGFVASPALGLWYT